MRYSFTCTFISDIYPSISVSVVYPCTYVMYYPYIYLLGKELEMHVRAYMKALCVGGALVKSVIAILLLCIIILV